MLTLGIVFKVRSETFFAPLSKNFFYTSIQLLFQHFNSDNDKFSSIVELELGGNLLDQSMLGQSKHFLCIIFCTQDQTSI